MSRRLLVIVVVVLVALLAGAGAVIAVVVAGDDVDPGRALDGRPCERQYVRLAPHRLPQGTFTLEQVPAPGAVDPNALAFAPDGSGDGLLGDRSGRIAWIEAGEITDDVVLDFRGDTLLTGDGGFMGIAFDPDGGWVYVLRADDDKDDHVEAFPLGPDGRPDQDGRVEVLYFDHPSSEQHHGGGFAFGPDGNLWIGMGDGGGLGDPRENAQNTGVLFGKILRIRPTPGGPEPYTVPEDNPFVDGGGAPEVWAYGLRNPFRLTFDEVSGDLWVSDVGQACWEELNLLAAADDRDPGAFLGWDAWEGTHPYEGDDRGVPVHFPAHQYAHRDGWCAIAAGTVVRDGEGPLADLDGFLLHTDYCKGRILAFRPGTSLADPPRLVDLGLDLDRPVAIVTAPDGTPWVLSLEGQVFRIVPGDGFDKG